MGYDTCACSCWLRGRFRLAQIRAISQEDLCPISDRLVKGLLDLRRFGIAVYFPQGISRIRILRITITELVDEHGLVADESSTLYLIAPDDRSLVPCFFFRILELRKCRCVCSSELRYEFGPLQVNERRRRIVRFRIQACIGVIRVDFAPLVHNGIALQFLQTGRFSLAIDLSEHLPPFGNFSRSAHFSHWVIV